MASQRRRGFAETNSPALQAGDQDNDKVRRGGCMMGGIVPDVAAPALDYAFGSVNDVLRSRFPSSDCRKMRLVR